jgi:hypothetical protein
MSPKIEMKIQITMNQKKKATIAHRNSPKFIALPPFGVVLLSTLAARSVSILACWGATSLDHAVEVVLVLVDPDIHERFLGHPRRDRISLVPAELEDEVAAGDQPGRGRPDDALQQRRPVGPAVQGRPGLEGEHVPWQQAELRGRDVRRHRGHDVDPTAELRWEGREQVSQPGVDAVPAGARDGGLVEVRGQHRGGRLGGAEHGRHRPAPGAQIHGDAIGREQRRGPPRERLGERPRNVDAGLDRDPQSAERDGARDPGERLSVEAPLEEPIEGGGVTGRRRDQLIGLLLGREEAAVRERADQPLPRVLRQVASWPRMLDVDPA